MTCKHVTNRLSDLALGALDGPRRTEAEAHVEQCAGCRAALERERKLMAAIDREVAGHVATEPSSDFAARVRTRLATVAPVEACPGRDRRPDLMPVQAAWVIDRRYSGRRYSGWTRAAAVALAAGMVVGAVWLARRREPCRGAGCSGGVPTAAAALTAGRTGAVLAEAGVNRSGAEAAVRTPPLQHAVSATPKTAVGTHSLRSGQAPQVQREALPVVIVDPHQQEDIARLYYAIQAKRVDLVSFLAVPPGFKREADGSLAAAPLEIEPAEPSASDLDSGGAESSPQPLR